MNDPRQARGVWQLVLLVALAMAFVGCGNGALPQASPRGQEQDSRLGVVVSVVPQRYFVERIGGEHVTVQVMVGLGEEPHTYEPRPDQLRAISEADVYFTIGVAFEDVWMGRIAAVNPEMRIVNTAADIERLPAMEHEHGDEGETHAGDGDGEALDPHVWTSPRLVARQAEIIAATLAELDPAHADAYQANLEAFEADIDALDAELRGALADVQGRAFMVFHPAWGYFARDYGLEQLAIEVGGQEPSARELAELVTVARERGIRVIFAQPEFSSADAETLAKEIEGEVLLVSPLAEDWLTNMREVADAFARAMTSQ